MRDRYSETMREETFAPYCEGEHYRAFILRTWDTFRTDRQGKSIIRYQLVEARPGGSEVEIFSGEDFHCSPLHAIDSDEAIRALMAFLTLKPGDTDAEYFEEYSEIQMDFAESHGESVYFELCNMFGFDI